MKAIRPSPASRSWLLLAAGACREGQAVDPVILSLDDQVVRRSEFARHVAALEAQGGERLNPAVLPANARVLPRGARARARGAAPGAW